MPDWWFEQLSWEILYQVRKAEGPRSIHMQLWGLQGWSWELTVTLVFLSGPVAAHVVLPANPIGTF